LADGQAPFPFYVGKLFPPGIFIRVKNQFLNLRICTYQQINNLTALQPHFSMKPILFLSLFLCWPAHAALLKVNGSTTVNLPVAEAAEFLRTEQKMEIQIDTQGGSSGGISTLGEGLVQVGMEAAQ
jgi:hypothetical protein